MTAAHRHLTMSVVGHALPMTLPAIVDSSTFESGLTTKPSTSATHCLPCTPNEGVDFGLLGCAHALRRIDLYPVRACVPLFPQSFFTYAGSPKTRVANQTTTRLQAAIDLPGRQPPHRWRGKLVKRVDQTLSVAPSGMTPSSTNRQRAIASFLASATIPTFRPRMPLSAKRSCHHSASLLLGWYRSQNQASSTNV